MANDKLWLAAEDGTLLSQPAVAKTSHPGCATVVQPEEGLRLIRAFSRISDPLRRAGLIEEAERISRT